MRTPSCVAAVDVVLTINGQALSTQVHRSPLTHFASCPLLVLPPSMPSITSLRALTELSSRCFQVPTLLPFPIKVHKFLLRPGNIHPILFRNSGPTFDIEANQPFEQDYLSKTPLCGTQIRQSTCVNQLVFRDD